MKKITQLTELTEPVDSDLLLIVDDPGGTPIAKKITRGNLIPDASDTGAGIIELATSAEVTTGSATDRAVTPDALRGSDTGKRVIVWRIVRADTALAIGDGKDYFHVPNILNGWNLVDFDIAVDVVSSSGTPTVQLHNLTDTVDMLSTAATIDANEYNSYDATTLPVIDASHDDVATGDRLRCDVDAAGTGTKGLVLIMTFQKP